MATRKSTVSTTTTAAHAATPSRARKAPGSRRASNAPARKSAVRARGFDVAKYVGPGAALLTTGALATAGYVLREHLADVLANALKTTTSRGSKAVDAARDGVFDAVEKVADSLSVDALLRRAGLQRTSTLGSIAGPAIGVACGFVAGAALTHLFGRQLLEQLMGASPSDSHDDPTDESPSAKATPQAVMDGTPVSGDAHRSTS